MTDTNRHMIRAAEEYFLRCVTLVNSIFPNDLLRGVIWIAIINANTYHLLDDAELGKRYASMNRIVPDTERRPVSRSAIAQSLGLPLETCRRHIKALLEAGHCVEVEGGVIVPAERLTGPLARQAMTENIVNLRRLMARLDLKTEL